LSSPDAAGVNVQDGPLADLDEFGTEFPHAIGNVAKRELAANGYTRYADLSRTTPRDLLAIHGVGPKAVRILGDELAARGLRWADP
jgi:hypothetical protein